MPYQIVTVPATAYTQLEQAGSKAKFWYWNDDGNLVLFKEGIPNSGEHWAEKICSELCALLELPHSPYELAVWRDRNGVVTPTFVPNGGRLIHGNELLAKYHSQYDTTKRYHARHHTIRRVYAVLSDTRINPPIDWTPPFAFNNSAGIFTGYLMLDALVSNQDRHHENWGLIISHEHGITISPTFDHASSLGRNETDHNRIDRLHTKDSGRSIKHYVERAESALYMNPASRKPLTTFEAFCEIAKIEPEAGQFWIEQLNIIKPERFKYLLSEIPNTLITDPAREFAARMLQINQQRLLKLY